MDLTLASQIMKDIAMYLLDEVEAQKLTPDRAAEISKAVPDILDEGMTDDKTHEAVTKLITTFPELSALLNEYVTKKEDAETEKLLEETQKSLEDLKKETAAVISSTPPQQSPQPAQSSTPPQPVQSTPGGKLV
ncbi:hypothetical protein HYW55_00075 [Candidatus Gottesmanbacteria bacterium]|nr:hypothetical protein [Candidatus Gottesmanbacteria bacterium]